PGEDLLALVAGRRPAGHVAARGARALERVVGRNAAILRDAQYLAGESLLVARGVVAPLAAAVPRVVASAVADRDVEIAVLAELDVPRVVVARCRRHVVDQHGLGR